MSLQSSVNLVIECRPSRRLSLLFGGFFSGAAVGVVVADIPVMLKIAFLAVLAAGVVSVFRRHILLLNPDSVVALSGAAGQWMLHTRDGNTRSARLAAAGFWVFDMVPLVFECDDGVRRGVLLAPDRVPQEALRRLHAWIRHRMPAA